jgi:putative ABC transport system substrate-binding protein
MRRREFISLVGGAAAWPLAAGAQQRMRRIGVLMNEAPANIDLTRGGKPFAAAAIEQGLRELNWIVGRNIQIDYRSGDPDLLRKYAAELVALAPDVIVANGTVALQPLLEVTRLLPIVFVAVSDPVGRGFVASLRDRAGTPLVSAFSNIASAVSGWACSSRSLRE